MAQIKLFSESDIIPSVTPLDWDVEINRIPYYVARFPGFIHTIGGKYGDNDLWAWPRSETPSYENLIEFNCSDPVAWGIRYSPENFIYHHWDELEAETGGIVMITRNGLDFCDVHGRGMNYGIDKARSMIVEIQEHPINFNEIDFDKHMIGRKVWWRSEPGIITRYIHGQACVMISPDGIEKFKTPPEFAKEDIDPDDENDIKTSIFDKNIWWFRE